MATSKHSLSPSPSRPSSRLSSSPPTSHGSSSQVYELNPLSHSEDLEDYRPGGLPPIEVGATYTIAQKTYRVVHKLGYGGFSTVWIAQVGAELVSLKFVHARHATSSQENQHLARLNNTPTVAPHVVSSLGSFTVPSANCTSKASKQHSVFVTRLLGPSISRLAQGFTRLHPRHARAVMRKTADALHSLHAAGMVHRDFTPRNVLLKLNPAVMKMSRAELYKAYGEPQKAPVVRLDGKPALPRAPEYCYAAIDFIAKPENILLEPAIIDFGASATTDQKPTKRLGIPSTYAAPEVILENTVSQASDVWSLGCIIYAARSGDRLFTGMESDTVNSMVCTLGAPPTKWQGVSFDEDGQVIIPGVTINHEADHTVADMVSTMKEESKMTLRSRVRDIRDRPSMAQSNNLFWGTGKEGVEYNNLQWPRISTAESDYLYDLLSKIFKWEPSQRITADQIRHHPWFSLS